jgi:DNA-binding transcriptional LysR family regulator
MKPRLDSVALSKFLAVAQSLSFRQAAEQLHISQPPLSRAIRELEERLGVRLFERDTQAVALTAAGRSLLPRARQIVALLLDAERAVTADNEPSVLRLGLTNAVEADWSAGLIERIRALRPQLRVVSGSDSSPKLVQLLRAKRLHAAFIALPTESSGLDVIVLDQQPLLVAMSASHRLARRRTLQLRDLADEPIFWFERARQPAFFDHCERVFARHSFAPTRVREPIDHHVLLAEVAVGRAIALLPQSFTSLQRRGVVYRSLREGDELSVGIGLATRGEDHEVRDLLKKCVQARVQVGRRRSAAAGASRG